MMGHANQHERDSARRGRRPVPLQSDRLSVSPAGRKRLGKVGERPSAQRYPFAAIVGMREARRALLLLAIDPRLKGALIAGAPGSAKSVLARSFQSLVERDDRSSSPPFVELPLNATEDNLLCGIDLQATLASGERRVSRGALARADGGAMYVDDVNLLDAGSADLIAAALEDGVVRLEREGISEAFAARFIFLGTSDQDEGETSANLRDRVGLLVETGGDESADEAAGIIERGLEFDKDPTGFVEAWAVETAAIRAQIEEARERLCQVAIGSEEIARIAEVAMRLGVEGNRADIFAVRTARASAALAGRDFIADEDIVSAIRLVLFPRATTLPENLQPNNEMRESPADASLQEPDVRERESPERPDADKRDRAPIEDLIIAAIGSPAPDGALTLEQRGSLKGGARVGKRGRTVSASRGRYTGVLKARRSSSRIAVDATLRAAAPHQVARRSKRGSASTDVARMTGDDLPVGRVKIMPDDLRFKRFKQRSGALFIFAVDASGSMSVNRMAQAKGAITRLLGEAYLHRDKVALISFRGAQADVLLAPTRSVELAGRLVDAMPTGGATPIAAGLIKALELARLARLQGMHRAVVLLMTDGRANVALRASELNRRHTSDTNELKEIGAVLKIEGVETVVIDTRSSFVSSGEAGRLAENIGARYLYLPRADVGAVSNAVSEVARQAR